MKKVLMSIGFLFMIVLLSACNKEVDQKNAYVTLDINPSFELITDDEGLIM